jgi:hypothetical protein
MQKFQKPILWALILSESSHIFCCVLPTVFSVLSLLAGLGLVGVMPGWLENVHALLHGWEVPVILMSGAVVAFGWALYFYSKRIDCHDHGCGHGPCEPRKDTTALILKIATILFFVNIAIWGVFHRGMGIFVQETTMSQTEARHDH